MAEKIAYVDFETAAIEARPEYPPRPAGVAIRKPGQRKSRYYAWNHPIENNCTLEEGQRALSEVWSSDWSISFHNAKFDEDVAETFMGLPLLPWQRTHDTMVLAYLVDPHAKRIGLKELAENRLGLLPTERDEVREWLIAQGIERRGTKQWGRSISKAPGKLVGKYAEGDTDRTKLVLESLLPEVKSAGMMEAYDRERRLIPVLLDNERQGVTIDLPLLEADVARYETALRDTERRIFKLLGSREFNLDAGEEIADALDKKYPGIQWPITPGGARSTSKESLQIVLETRPPLLYALFVYHATLTTCVRTFMRPWMEVAQRANGRIHTQWNSVAQSDGGGSRTGRFSSSPNFQNIPTLKSRGFVAAIALWEKHLKKLGLPGLPAVRGYVVADSEDDVLLDRDFSQQELRVLAHFEDGDMMQAFIANPRLDLHEYAAEVIFRETSIKLTRKETKNIAFGLLYGMGLGALAELLGIDVGEAKKSKAAYLNTFPGIKEIQQDLAFRGKNGLPMVTWGGRRYFAEPSKVVKGVLRDFYYKLFNYLIQGSSSDVTKEAWLRYEATKKHGRMLLTVHDQIIVNCPKKAWKEEMKILKEAMNGIELGAPLMSDGAYGYRWAELQDCD